MLVALIGGTEPATDSRHRRSPNLLRQLDDALGGYSPPVCSRSRKSGSDMPPEPLFEYRTQRSAISASASATPFVLDDWMGRYSDGAAAAPRPAASSSQERSAGRRRVRVRGSVRSTTPTATMRTTAVIRTNQSTPRWLGGRAR